MTIKKRLKDYPKNVPRKLFQLLKSFEWNRTLMAKYLGVNGGYISNLLNKGIEPPDTTDIGRDTRRKLYLKPYKKGRIKLHRTKQKIDQPEYMKKWSHLSKEERHKVIKTYIEWKEKNNEQKQ
jgi:hypothetical protein